MRAFFIAVFFIPLTIGCSNKAESNKGFTASTVDKKTLKLKHIRNFRLDTSVDTTLIANPFPLFKISNDGNRIAFNDMLYNHIVLFDSLGNPLSIIGKEGRGPAEFVNVTSWNFDKDNNLIVFDQAQKLIKVFNSIGKLKKSAKIFSGDKLLGFGVSLSAYDSLIYMGILQAQYNSLKNAENSKLIGVSNYNGKLQRTIGKYDPYVAQAKMYTAQPIFNIDFSHNKIYSTHMNSYRIQVYNLNSNHRTSYFGYKSPHFIESKDKISPFAPKYKRREMALNQSFTRDIFYTKNYILLYFYNLTEKWYKSRFLEGKKYFISVYDKRNFDFIDEISLPYNLGSVHNNMLYLVEDSNPDHYTIGVYALQEHH